MNYVANDERFPTIITFEDGRVVAISHVGGGGTADYSDAEICRKRGWTVGTRLVGDEGYGPTVIEITGLGETHLLAREISHNGVPEKYPREGNWTLSGREWKKVESTNP